MCIQPPVISENKLKGNLPPLPPNSPTHLLQRHTGKMSCLFQEGQESLFWELQLWMSVDSEFLEDRVWWLTVWWLAQALWQLRQEDHESLRPGCSAQWVSYQPGLESGTPMPCHQGEKNARVLEKCWKIFLVSCSHWSKIHTLLFNPLFWY